MGKFGKRSLLWATTFILAGIKSHLDWRKVSHKLVLVEEPDKDPKEEQESRNSVLIPTRLVPKRGHGSILTALPWSCCTSLTIIAGFAPEGVRLCSKKGNKWTNCSATEDLSSLFLSDRLSEETDQSSTQAGKHGREILYNGMTRLTSPPVALCGNDAHVETCSASFPPTPSCFRWQRRSCLAMTIMLSSPSAPGSWTTRYRHRCLRWKKFPRWCNYCSGMCVRECVCVCVRVGFFAHTEDTHRTSGIWHQGIPA